MPLIHLTTFIAAPQERVFDLSRSINLHQHSMQKHSEKAIDGVLTGLVQLNDTVTWKAKHLFRERMLKSKITALDRPHSFIDEQVKGDFAMLKHEHFFKPAQNGTIMIDQFRFESPKGFIGKLVNYFYLTGYLTKLLESRNQIIKEVAESNQWKQFLNQ